MGNIELQANFSAVNIYLQSMNRQHWLLGRHFQEQSDESLQQCQLFLGSSSKTIPSSENANNEHKVYTLNFPQVSDQIVILLRVSEAVIGEYYVPRIKMVPNDNCDI